MSKHNPDLISCRKLPGIGALSSLYSSLFVLLLSVFTMGLTYMTAIGRLCE